MRQLTFGLFLLLAIAIFWPLFPNVWYPVHDTTSIARAYLLADSLRHGQIPALWAFPIQYPLFHFYAPLFTYLSLGVKALSGSYFLGIKLVLFATCLIGTLGMYRLASRWGRVAGLLSATAFALLPYAAVNLYVRGAYAEYLSLNLLPWVFWAWSDITVKRRQLFAGIITTLFLLSHNLIPLITFPFLLVWIIIHRPSTIVHYLLPTFVTLGLGAFYLLPLFFERQFVVADAVATTTDYARHFVAPSQLWNSLWGFGGSAPGLEDGMSFKLGKLHLIMAALGLVALFRSRSRRDWFIPLALFGALFMTTSASQFLWRSLPFLPLVQFPWRFLTLAGFFLSLLAGYAAIILPRSLRLPYMLLAISCLLFLNLKLFRPQSTFPTNLYQFTSSEYLSTIPLIIPEYQPVWLALDNPTYPDYRIIATPYYPTWRVMLDGQSVPTFPSPEGYLAFTNPAGSSNYYAYQSHTPLEQIGNIISLLSALSIVIYAVYVQKT